MSSMKMSLNVSSSLACSESVKFKSISYNFRKVRKRRFGQLHVGGSKLKKTSSEFYWALDPPQTSKNYEQKDLFLDKCLLLCTIFGLYQNLYFSSLRKNKTFVYLQNIHSSFTNKCMHARNILIRELQQLLLVTKLKTTGPYQLQATVEILHKEYKCQFFVFTNSTLKQKLHFMYPTEYNDELIPIYLHQNYSDENHLIYIKNLKSYFRANYQICFECKKSFRSSTYRHLCKVRPSCFVCRRFFQSPKTYLHEKLIDSFCDKLVSEEQSFLCKICNCTIYSNHCYRGHRKLCYGKGHFGYKCHQCNHFIYANSKVTSKILKETHSCSDQQICKFCLNLKEENHICPLRKTKLAPFHNRLAFFILEIEALDSLEPIWALIFKEETRRGQFTKYFISESTLQIKPSEEEYFFNYFTSQTKNTDFSLLKTNRKNKVTEDFRSHIKLLGKANNNFDKEFLLFLLSSHHTTFVCQDKDGKIMVNLRIISFVASIFALEFHNVIALNADIN